MEWVEITTIRDLEKGYRVFFNLKTDERKILSVEESENNFY